MSASGLAHAIFLRCQWVIRLLKTIICIDGIIHSFDGRQFAEREGVLRISSQVDAERTVLTLEGRLVDVWVDEAESHWAMLTASTARHSLVVDLRAVLGVDAAGQRFLARLRDAGAEFVVCGCAMRALVAELMDMATGDRRDQMERTNR
jgi:hypothetical protein